MNKTFASFSKTLDKDHYLQSIEASFAALPSYRRFPSDEEFSRDLKTRDLYNFPRRSYWLRRMENHHRKELMSVQEYTIEHIMPQNQHLSAAWKSDLGPEWERVQPTWLHTLGNLTLTGYNSEYSDRPFSEKRDMKGGFKESPLRMNQGLGQLQRWDEDAIKARADQLADKAVGVWPAPERPVGLSLAKKPTTRQTGYTISDHPYLVSGHMRGLFEAFRKDVLALDPCVTEEFRKKYVAYKAETNFVDVVPQAKRLWLTLNMAFPEINDPKGICKNVTGSSQWGNGDVAVGMSSIEELPYIMGLVRQSLEKQLGSGNDA